MTLSSLSLPDLVGICLGFILTVFVFSYLVGDNPFFRFAVHVFIGMAAGFAAVMVITNVIWNQLIALFLKTPGASIYLILPPMLAGVVLLIKLFPQAARIGNPIMAYLVGAGAATAIGGATLGTIFPQIGATTSLFSLSSPQATSGSSLAFLVRGGIILVGTVTTLLYFQFGVKAAPDQPARRPEWIERLGWIGMIFIAITFGALFAGVYSAALTALIERLQFLFNTLLLFIR
ncbi:MAG: hypothetical protein ACM3PY_08735 [Omnitrophica WOR_2 bacterium]